MTEAAEAPEQQEVEEQQPQGGAEPAPPWGSDEEFDPERAWKLIQNIRKEKDELKPLAEKARELEDSQKSEQQRLNEERDALAKERDLLRGELLRERVARKHGLPDKLASRLQGDDEESLEADAKELAELIPQTRGVREPVDTTSVPEPQKLSPQELAEKVRRST